MSLTEPKRPADAAGLTEPAAPTDTFIPTGPARPTFFSHRAEQPCGRFAAIARLDRKETR